MQIRRKRILETPASPIRTCDPWPYCESRSFKPYFFPGCVGGNHNGYLVFPQPTATKQRCKFRPMLFSSTLFFSRWRSCILFHFFQLSKSPRNGSKFFLVSLSYTIPHRVNTSRTAQPVIRIDSCASMYAAIMMHFVITRFIYSVCKAIPMDQSKVKQRFFSKVIIKTSSFSHMVPPNLENHVRMPTRRTAKMYRTNLGAWKRIFGKSAPSLILTGTIVIFSTPFQRYACVTPHSGFLSGP